MENRLLPQDGPKRVTAILSTYAAVFGLFAAFQQFFEPFTADKVWALVTAVVAAAVLGAVILGYVLVGKRPSRRKVAASVVVVLAVIVFVGGVLMGTLLQAPRAGGLSSTTGTTSTPAPSAASATTGPGAVTGTSPGSPTGTVAGPTTPGPTHEPTRTPPPATTTPEPAPPPPPTQHPNFAITSPDTVTFCTDVRGVGDRPAEGAAMMLVRQVNSENVYSEQAVAFHGDGTWTADNVTVGNPGEENDYLLTVQAMTTAEVDWYQERYRNSQESIGLPAKGRPVTTKQVHRSNAGNTC